MSGVRRGGLKKGDVGGGGSGCPFCCGGEELKYGMEACILIFFWLWI